MINLNKIGLTNNLYLGANVFCRHPFHILAPSVLPLFASLGAFSFRTGAVRFFWKYFTGYYIRLFGLVFILLIRFLWFGEVINESNQGYHTLAVQKNRRRGFILFLVSEVRLFVSFFWAFFHSALSPTIWIGCKWPPIGIAAIDPLALPLFNTCVLLTSGFFVTAAHKAMFRNIPSISIIRLLITICFGVVFRETQALEFIRAPFSISDGIYGSTFYALTGLHGRHVIVGVLSLFINLLLIYFYQHSSNHHYGLEASIWYWHFVDVVWILLYISLYCWGS